MLELQVREDMGSWTVETYGDNGLLARNTYPTEAQAEAYAKRCADFLGARIVARVVPTRTLR
jgi:hypothetical protein